MKRSPVRSAVFIGPLFCLLAGTPADAHQGIHNAGARDACETESLGAACEWHDERDARYIGTCRSVANALLCVRNKPIIYPDEQADDS